MIDMQPNFSVCLIAKNESKTLPRMMASLKEFQEKGGEVWLLDTGSTDGTAQIARDLGCKVEEVGEKFVTVIDEELAKKLNNHFIIDGEKPLVEVGQKLFDYASARNYIADFASNDMIATPDCDEVYTKLDLDRVQKEITDGADQLEYNFVFSHDQFGNEVIKFMHCKFYNRKKLKWQGVVHEVLVGNAQKRIFLDESIIKLEHWQNHETNRSGYLRGLALDCYLNPSNDRNSHYLGREMLWTGRPKSAIKELERHIGMNQWPTERAQSMIFIGEGYKMLGNEDKAIEWFHKSFLLESGRREPLIKLAQYFYEKGDAQKVVAYIGAALEIGESFYYANDLSHYTNYPHELMYWAKWVLGDKEGSKKHWEKAFSYQPHNEKYLFDARWYMNLPKVSFIIPTLGREEGLKKCIDSIKNLNYPQDKIEIIIKEDSFENNQGVPKLVKKGFEESTGEWIVFASNDIEFTKNSLIEAYLYAKDKGFVAFNTGIVSPDEGNVCEHFMIRRDVVEKIGEIFDTRYYHLGVDNLLWAKMKKLGIADRCKDAIVNHYHFSKGYEFDNIYKLAWNEEHVKHDRELLKQDLEKLNAE